MNTTRRRADGHLLEMDVYEHDDIDLTSDIDLGLDLRCDFPARDSFRESLLGRLRTLHAAQNRAGENPTPLHRGPDTAREPISAVREPTRAQRLSDDDLDLLAAAGGDEGATMPAAPPPKDS